MGKYKIFGDLKGKFVLSKAINDKATFENLRSSRTARFSNKYVHSFIPALEYEDNIAYHSI